MKEYLAAFWLCVYVTLGFAVVVLAARDAHERAICSDGSTRCVAKAGATQ